jgi:hypothetical protein
MNKRCYHCGTLFLTNEEDLAFFDKISPVVAGRKELVPPPTLCADCRQQRRLTFRNERHLYARKCDAIGKSIIAMYPATSPFPVYSQEYWWSDKWQASDYAQEWNPEASFFSQFAELQRKTPRLGCIISSSENCEFNNFCVGSKNCYMSQRVGDSEDAY